MMKTTIKIMMNNPAPPPITPTTGNSKETNKKQQKVLTTMHAITLEAWSNQTNVINCWFLPIHRCVLALHTQYLIQNKTGIVVFLQQLAFVYSVALYRCDLCLHSNRPLLKKTLYTCFAGKKYALS